MANIPTLIISLDSDRERFARISKELAKEEEGFNPERIPAVPGSHLPDLACFLLTAHPEWTKRKGEIGCFLSHVKVWEFVEKLKVPFALVLEDDAILKNISRLYHLKFPDKFDLVFINDRTSVGSRHDPPDKEVFILPIEHALYALDKTGFGVGSDGYLLTPEGATKLLHEIKHDLMFGNIDWRLMRYSVTPNHLEKLNGTRVSTAINFHHNQHLPPAWGILKAFCLNTPLVAFGTTASRIVHGISTGER